MALFSATSFIGEDCGGVYGQLKTE